MPAPLSSAPQGSAPQEVLSLAEQGARVFPLAPGSKKPLFTNWQLENNSSRLKDIENWALEFPNCNWGMLCGELSGRWVLDIDCKHSLAGLDVYQHWIEQYGPEWTYTLKVRTPSGGLHLHFPWEPGIRRQIGTLARGVDVLGCGSFAVIPPSRIAGQAYRFEDSDPESNLASIPMWLYRMVERIIVRPPKSILHRLEDLPVYEGDRHKQLFDYLWNLRLSGASLEVLKFAARDLNRRFEPPYGEDELDRQAMDVFKRFYPIKNPVSLPLRRNGVEGSTEN